jgi:hypothetical protein
MKKFAIITKIVDINTSTKKGFSGEVSLEKDRTTVIRFFGLPIFKSTITIL